MKLRIYEKNSVMVYDISFHNLIDLYDYVKSNPAVNGRVFTHQDSLNMKPSQAHFYGEPLSVAVEYLRDGYAKELDNFLKINEDLKKTITVNNGDNYRIKRGLYGGLPLASLVASGVHDCMLSLERTSEVRVINIYYNLSYSRKTTEEQIRNRGLATLYIIEALENAGVYVNFHAFQLTKSEKDHANEKMHISVNLKSYEDLILDIQKCYFPLVAKEFLRRILFRVAESCPVRELKWSVGLGYTCNSSEVKEFYDVQPDDLIIGSPSEMEITGEDIYADTYALIKKLGIEEEFDIKQIKKLSRKV